MTFPIQWGWQQIILLLVAIAAVGLIISSMMSLVVKVKEIDILEDEQGRSYRRIRRRRRFRLHRGIWGLLLLVGAMRIFTIRSVIRRGGLFPLSWQFMDQRC